MTTVAITGATTDVGRALIARLDGSPDVAGLVAIDGEPPQMPPPRLEYRAGTPRDPLFANAIGDSDTLVHLSEPETIAADEDTRYAVTVRGTERVLEAAEQRGVSRLVMVSSATVYGAHPDNALPIEENAPLRATPDFALAYHRRLAEERIAEWTDRHPEVSVTVLRPAPLLSAEADDPLTRYLEFPRLLTVRGYAPPLQFTHPDDVAGAAAIAATRDLPGAYNVAADGWLSTSEVCAILGRRPVAVPEQVAFSAAEVLWRVGALTVPAGAVQFAMHPCVLSTERLHAAGWAPGWSNREILREFAATHREYLAFGRARVRRRDLYVGVGAALGLLTGLGFGGRYARRR